MLNSPLLNPKESSLQASGPSSPVEAQCRRAKAEEILRGKQMTKGKTALNTNILYGYLFCFFDSVAFGIWASSTVSAYIFRLTDSKIVVGNLEAVQGLATLISAPLCGWLADKYRRDYILKIAAVCDMATTGVLVYLIWRLNNITYFYPTLALLGFFSDFRGASLEAIFADSMSNEERSAVYSRRTIIRCLGKSIGPTINIVLFMHYGNEWSLEVLEKVMTVGLGLQIFARPILFFFEEKKVLGEETEAVTSQLENPGCLARNVATIMCCSEFFILLGAGMTVKFFPIFFLEEVGTPPIEFNIANVILPLALATTTLVVLRISKCLGRLLVINLLFLCGAGTLILLATQYNMYVLLVVYVLRYVLANGGNSLWKAILMQHVQRKNRGKYASLELLMGTCWTGSASLGGYLANWKGFRFIYYITSGIYIAGAAITCPLFSVKSTF